MSKQTRPTRHIGLTSAVRALVCAATAAIASFGPTAFAHAEEPLRALPISLDVDLRKASLGERMFNDKRLSRDNTISCASCHDLKKGGADGLVSSTGIGRAKGPINAPTVYNAALNFRQFWDGRAATLEDQAAGPVHNPKEMGSNWNEVLAKLTKDGEVVSQFQAAYPDGLRPKNIQDAIATFERTLITPNSRFDKYLRGERAALSADEARGYQLFKSYGCVACHQGANIGGNMFQTFGVMGDYFAKRGNVGDADLGRYNVTKNAADKHVFKVPSLRNVALTAPYFHDGSAATLPDAVDVMFRFQLGRSASPQDKDLIVQFLQTLTGEYKGRSLEPATFSASR